LKGLYSFTYVGWGAMNEIVALGIDR
jgi:hypothetical protein